MGYLSSPTSALSSTNSWWGTVIAGASGYTPAPWIYPQDQSPGSIYYLFYEGPVYP